MDANLKGKVAIITGASRGIGKAIAQRLSSEGMRLILAARSDAALQEVAASCKTECHALALDLRQEESPQTLISYAISKFGSVDLLVNNAGATKRGDFLDLTEADWSDGFALKFFSAVRCSRSAWPHLVKSGGAIVNIAGIGGRTGMADFSIGGSVNSALLNLTKVLADKGIVEGVKVNAINPGYIETDRLRARIDSLASSHNISHQQASTEMARQLEISRFGHPDEIASAVAFMASPLSSYCQGTILDIDGGQTRTL
ncbi:MAG: SDR family oxidoreductase [Gallionellaceae bacterium]|nr:MAG: SDR family oxidoreductase [Gallionellaceae bacterium]